MDEAFKDSEWATERAEDVETAATGDDTLFTILALARPLLLLSFPPTCVCVWGGKSSETALACTEGWKVVPITVAGFALNFAVAGETRTES